jgi:hypothetical protein
VSAHVPRVGETKEEYRARRTAEREALIASGKCPVCYGPLEDGLRFCRPCRVRQFTEYQPVYRADRGMDPTRRRCGLCRQHGHNRSTCDLRRALATTEAA